MGGTHSSNSYGEGTRIGRVISFMRTGIFWKTYEVEMICRSSIDGRNKRADELAERFEDALKANKNVEIRVLTPYFATPCAKYYGSKGITGRV